MARRYHIRQAERSVSNIEAMIEKATKAQQRPEYIAVLQERLERAQLKLLDYQEAHLPPPLEGV